ncbi:MAG TPA: type II toxin-antitoxin system RelE/ParE family toxin [Planctomycetota bacterium]|nr:type II toxin-antitoxin system RelE/ParE family toxin [Planctomycetota bacterium]HRR79569.1 type II toxin-antitoxin system RelE/ParE family toxin [Planctomycetota bacterium]HRT94412.1 type II toxin-antitoxin system RelE/ParE family toxin [Planctomycetota bacterium]
MKVHWTDTAQAHLDAIRRYIAQDSVEYALRMVDRLTRRSQVIAGFPLSGRTVPEYERDDLREVIEGPYRLIYLIRDDRVDVIAVIHGARDLRAAMEHAGWSPQQRPT